MTACVCSLSWVSSASLFFSSNISSYLRNNAWSDDCERNTKVFLVRDKTSKQIVFYFSLNCGILYEDFLDDKLKDEEKIVFKKYVEALSRLKECDEKEQKKPLYSVQIVTPSIISQIT